MQESIPRMEPKNWLSAHGDVLYAYAMSRLRDREEAEEVVQETFLGALRNIQQFDRRGAEGAWLMGILKNKVVDRMRAISKAAVSLEGEDKVVENLFDKKGNWSLASRKAGMFRLDSLEATEFREVFEKCFERLPKNQAAVFNLKEVHQENSDEVCKVLGISSTNLWVLMHRARLRLAECIKARWSMEDA